MATGENALFCSFTDVSGTLVRLEGSSIPLHLEVHPMLTWYASSFVKPSSSGVHILETLRLSMCLRGS